MHVEVDQSGKIGKTNEDTVLAFSNGLAYSVLISRQTKQQCVRELRRRGLSPQAIYLRLFAAGLYFLLRGYMATIELALIDVEYPGQDAQIKEHLYNLLHRSGVKAHRDQVSFGYIGKQSAAHAVAIAVFRGERPADLVLTIEEILGEF